MKTNAAPENTGTVVKLEVMPKPKRTPATVLRQRFRIRTFTNHGGSQSWRVEGTKRDGSRIRENYAELDLAQQRQIQLESEYHSRTQDSEADRRATKLTDMQLRLCESALFKLDCDDDLLPAVDYWLRHGKQNEVPESPRLDEAVEQFKAWLDGATDENGNGICTLRECSRAGLHNRVSILRRSIGNLRVNDITPDTLEGLLNKLKVSPVTRDNYRRGISRFFSWCIQRPRRWASANPCREIKIEQGEKAPPTVLSVSECKALLAGAEKLKGGKLAPYVAVCLFSGLRPEEAARLDWQSVNLADKEIRLEGTKTKTGRPRVIAICDTLAAWLKAHKGKEFYPANWRKDFDSIKVGAGFGNPNRLNKKQREKALELKPWPADVMRHTAISHYFRKTGSYGQTAEQFGNSEAIIKNHYQGRVNSNDTKAFYALRPTKGASK